ncbi:unnamed protein product [Phytophthora fragariaefolia]|uniref:Unnamed protein product n=1 Tax=Phytophthora fragariaefolia TaxID=1490495 RepID=A0A9W7D6P1_9STRA|nr:unnamed protein product [Phytophthora fragariaefolia]
MTGACVAGVGVAVAGASVVGAAVGAAVGAVVGASVAGDTVGAAVGLSPQSYSCLSGDVCTNQLSSYCSLPSKRRLVSMSTATSDSLTSHVAHAVTGARWPQPTDGSTQPQVESETSRHSASSGATQLPPVKDDKYARQSATATSPVSGQAVPVGAAPLPAQTVPRESATSASTGPERDYAARTELGAAEEGHRTIGAMVWNTVFWEVMEGEAISWDRALSVGLHAPDVWANPLDDATCSARQLCLMVMYGYCIRVDKEDWDHVPWSDAFVDIEGKERKPAEHPLTRFKMMYDDDTLYVGAELIEPKIWGTITEKNSTIELEVNCLNTIWELLLHRPYKDGYSIDNPFNLVSLRSAVFVDGLTNSPETECVRWCVEMSWSLAELQQFGKLRFRREVEGSFGAAGVQTGRATPRPPSASGRTTRSALTTTCTVAGDVWRVNFSRVQYELETVVNADTQQLQYQKVPDKREDNIVWAATGVIDIHRPERWGYVFFSSENELPGGELELSSAMSGFLEERMAIERILDAVYYRQRAFHASHGGFASTMAMLYTGLPPQTSPTSSGLPDDEVQVWKEAFPLRKLLHRYELDSPVISFRSDLATCSDSSNEVSKSARGTARSGARTASDGNHRKTSRHYAPALDQSDEDFIADLNALAGDGIMKENPPPAVMEISPPPLSPRSQKIQSLETRGLFSNFTVTVRSTTQEWHMAQDGRLWQTAASAWSNSHRFSPMALASSFVDKDVETAKTGEFGYDSGAQLMVSGSQALHDHVAGRLEQSLGKRLPQVEVRFKNVSASVSAVVQDETQGKSELPTLPNVVKLGVLKMLAKKRVVEKQILHTVSGVLKPSTMTLVLGQPGSGKSSLMKLLSGKLSTSGNLNVEGEVTYNGILQDEIRKRLPQFVTYVPQHDNHLPTLTTRETLQFAHECSGGELSKRDERLLVHGSDEENRAAVTAARALRKHYPDVVIRQLGLENCHNTIVGDVMQRGVSGGERKRITTGEMAFGENYVTIMDEISTGLDSAATIDIISTIRSSVKRFRKTLLISLLQPSPEVFALFDDVILLNDGYVMYHGPREQALDYFESLGFKCPPHRDVADFLLDLGTNKQHQYEVGPAPATAEQFREAFEQSGIYQNILNDLQEPVSPVLLRDNELHVISLPEFHQTFWSGTWTLVKREMTVTLRDTTAMKSRFFMAILLGLLQASTFYQFDDVDSQVVMGIAFVSINFVNTNHMALIPPAMAMRDVIGFVLTASGYILFELVLFFVSMVAAALYFFVACASPNTNIAFPVTQLLNLFFVTFSGYVVTKDTIPDYMIWVYWISPQGWGVRALAVNQYNDPRFVTCVYEGVDYCSRYGMQAGEYLLSVYGVPTEKYWLWLGLVVLAALSILLLVLSCLVLEYCRYESPTSTVVSGVPAEESYAEDEYAQLKTPKNARDDERVDVVLPPVKNFVPVTLAFNNLWYSVPDPSNPKEDINLLKGVSGFALPGTMTALMGSSGAGKTTLMDVIAGRKTGGKINGEIMLNGHAATELAIRRSTGYCEQMDIHSDTATFREALTFSAFLRQGTDVPESRKYDSVNECLDLLDLNPIADQIIRGSSMEQKKRLTIGVELAAQPSVLLLDEPTSGLDARSAKLIMDGVRKVAATGRTIVCTIHQPSTLVFELFDSLLLLKRGGEMVYFGKLGEKASELVNYFEAIDGVTKLDSGYNPATWMLEVIRAGVGNLNADTADFVALFKESEKYRQLQSVMDSEGVMRPSQSLSELTFSHKRAASNMTQASFLITRFFNLYWRTASYNLTRIVISVILGLLFGITYVEAEYNSYQGINSGMGMIFMAASYITFVTLSGVLPVTYQERVVFYRERAGQTCNAFWYFIGATIVEIPYSYLGQLLIYLLPGIDVASVFGLLINTILILFTGMNPPASSLPRGYVWLYHATPNKYTFASLTAIVFEACDGDGHGPGCQQMTGTPPTLADGITVAQYMEDLFKIKYSEIWSNCGYVVAWIVFLRLLALLALRFVNHTKR